MTPVLAVVTTVEFVEVYLAGDILFALQIAPQIKLVAHIRETGLLQIVAIMLFVQEVLVEQFVMETLATVSNFMRGEIASIPFYFNFKEEIYEENIIDINCYDYANRRL